MFVLRGKDFKMVWSDMYVLIQKSAIFLPIPKTFF